MRRVLLPLLLFAALVAARSAAASPYGAAPLEDRIRACLGPAAAGDEIEACGDRILAARTTLRFYRDRGFRPAWVDGLGAGPFVAEVVRSLERAGDEGLRPSDYHLAEIRRLLAAPPVADSLVALDLLLTDAWLLYGSHRLSGRIDPETIDAEWIANRREADLAAALDEALAAGRPAAALDDLLPEAPGYVRLRRELARYRAMAADTAWAVVGDGEMLRAGDRSGRVARVRSLLDRLGDLPLGTGADPDSFDQALEAAVRRFQMRHGLEPDGVIGPKTVLALETTPARRARQILLNLERWRWLPQDLGARHIRVNIADYSLEIVEDAHVVDRMGAIVGRDYRRTPVFSANMTYLVFHPTWEVPHQLAVEDVLREVKKDPAYLDRLGFQVFTGWGAGEAPVDPASIDWSRLSRGNFPYRLRQLPGPANALGQVKFMFPNRFSVYLHDTPAKNLFRKSERAFSSGCIRVERPLDLAAYVLAGDRSWSRAAIESVAESDRQITVRLPKPIPVHLLYWTAWVDEDGTVEFRNDIYGRDRLLDEALREEPPRPGEEEPAEGNRE